MIPALLLQGMKLGSLPRVLATIYNKEIVHGMNLLLEEWSYYLSYDRVKIMKMDPQTVARLQGSWSLFARCDRSRRPSSQ
ncbi:hypothetical protein BJX70DRAFT_383696 [Aspergillus crustosus]